MKPEADEEIGRQAHTLPAHIEVEEGVTKYEQEHRSDKEIEVGKEAATILIVGHISDGIDMNKRSDAGNEQDERDR